MVERPEIGELNTTAGFGKDDYFCRARRKCIGQRLTTNFVGTDLEKNRPLNQSITVLSDDAYEEAVQRERRLNRYAFCQFCQWPG